MVGEMKDENLHSNSKLIQKRAIGLPPKALFFKPQSIANRFKSQVITVV